MSTSSERVLEIHDLAKAFKIGRSGLKKARTVHAVNGVSLHIERGETLGLVGESGSGKSTLARLIMGLIEPTAGTVQTPGGEVTEGLGGRAKRRDMQMVFQDPHSSFDPLSAVGDSIAEPLVVHFDLSRSEIRSRVRAVLDRVGLPMAFESRYPAELSGGQLQRAAIARALVAEPELLVLDEPVSALDVSTQAQIINLLQDLQADLGTSYLFIAHDLSVVRHISNRIAVMYLGEVVEEGPADRVYTEPAHPYTQALLSAVPVPDPVRQRSRRRIVLSGAIPSPLDLPPGCHFHSRCGHALEICSTQAPPAYAVGESEVRCHLYSPSPHPTPLAELRESKS